MADNQSNGGSADTPESLKAEREDLEATAAFMRQMARDLDAMAEQRKSFDAERFASFLQMKGPDMRIRVWAGIRSPEGFQWYKEWMARKKALMEQILQHLATFVQAAILWEEDLERRERQQQTALLASPSEPVVTGGNEVMPDELNHPGLLNNEAFESETRHPQRDDPETKDQIERSTVSKIDSATKSVEGAVDWIWNEDGVKATTGIITDVVDDLGWGTIYTLSRASDYANNILSSDDLLEVLTHDVPTSEISEAAAKNMDPAAKAGWYDPSNPGNNAAKILLNVGTIFIDPENAANAVPEEARAEATAENEALTLKPYNEGGGHHIPAKSALEGAENFNANTALAIPKSVLESLKLDHGAMTGAQQVLYRAYAKTGQPLTWDAMHTIETKALVKGGVPWTQASATVTKAINAVKASGVAQPTRIPRGG